MRFDEQISMYYIHPEQQIKMSYAQLIACNMDIGFTSEVKGGRDFHQITRDISLSVMRFNDQHLTNLLFSNGQPIRLELTDHEIISYFSDYIELRYIIEGYLNVEIEGEVAQFTEKEICFIDSMAYHREIIADSNCILLNISIKPDIFNEAFLSSVGLSPLQKFLRANIMKKSRQQHYLRFTPNDYMQNDMIQMYLSNIFFEAQNHAPGYLDICKGNIIRLMDRLSTEYRYNFNEQDSKIYCEKLFESVSDYMQQNLNSITMKDLTENFHYQANYFNKLTKEFTGMTYSQYLIHLRIVRAKTLLETTRLSVDDIMWIIGYSNKGFFYKKFREFVGMSPAEYRNNN